MEVEVKGSAPIARNTRLVCDVDGVACWAPFSVGHRPYSPGVYDRGNVCVGSHYGQHMGRGHQPYLSGTTGMDNVLEVRSNRFPALSHTVFLAVIL